MVTIHNWQIDFAKLKERVNILQIIDRYGWRDGLTQKGKAYVGRCPMCGVGERSFTVTPPRAWKCFGECDAGGNQIDLVARQEGVELKQAAVVIAEAFGITDCDREPRRNTPAGRQPRSAERAPSKATLLGGSEASDGEEEPAENQKPQQHIPKNVPLGWKKPLQGLTPEHPWFDELGFLPDTIAEFGIGYCERGMMAERVAIPIFNREHELLAYAGRDIHADGRVYKFPEKFRKELELYNIQRALESERYEGEGLVIVPDFFDVVRLYELGIDNVVALMDAAASDFQRGLLLDLENPSGCFTVMVGHLDHEAGCALVHELAYIGYVHLASAPMYETVAEIPLAELQNLAA